MIAPNREPAAASGSRSRFRSPKGPIAAVGAVALFAWVTWAGAGTPNPEEPSTTGELLVVDVAPPSELVVPMPAVHQEQRPPPPRSRLMPIFATIDGAVLHDAQPLWAAWIEPAVDRENALYIGLASGIAPQDVAVLRVGEVGADERIASWGNGGIIVAGSGGTRLIALPADLPRPYSG